MSGPLPGWVGPVAIGGFILANAGSGLCFRYVSASSGRALLSWYVAGNVVGFLCTIFLPLALKDRNPNLVYAACFGGAFVALQLGSWWLFRAPLTVPQAVGIGLVGMGIVVMQWR